MSSEFKNPMDEWIRIAKEREQERLERMQRAKLRRQRLAVINNKRMKQLDELYQPGSAVDKIQMQITPWEIDEFGNLSRKIYSR